MKKKYFDARFWPNITERRLAIKEVDGDDFKGIISLLSIDGVNEPEVWSFGEYDFPITDAGMEWFRMMPADGKYNITAVLNKDKKIIIWYADIIKDFGYDEVGDLYFYDMYLDVIALPNGIVKVKDMEDLQAALADNIIGTEDFDAALAARDELINIVFKDIKAFHELTIKLRGEFD